MIISFSNTFQPQGENGPKTRAIWTLGDVLISVAISASPHFDFIFVECKLKGLG